MSATIKRASAVTMEHTSGLLGVVLAIVVSVGMLSIAASVLKGPWITVNGLNGPLNDQVGYITTARNLVQYGVLQSNLIYPAYVGEEYAKNTFYMPGFYYLSAALYNALGYSDFVAILPNLTSFVIAAVCIYLMGRRLYDWKTALLATVLWSSFPTNPIFGLSAMSEMALIGAACVALCLFLYIPHRAQPYVAPLLLAIPFVFRETSATLVIVMVIMVLWHDGRYHVRPALFCFLASFTVLSLILRSALGAGRPSIQAVSLFFKAGSVYSAGEWVPRAQHSWGVYTDATLVRSIHPAALDWLTVIPWRLSFEYRNALLLEGVPKLTILVVIGAAIVGLVAGGVLRDRFLFAAGFCMAVTFGLNSIYSLLNWPAARQCMLLLPLAALVAARLWMQISQSLKSHRPPWMRRSILALETLALGAMIWAGLALATDLLDDNNYIATVDAANTAFIDGIGHDQQRTLVSPSNISLDYVLRRYPVTWSFIPSNAETMRLLMQRYDVGTLVLQVTDRNTWNETDMQPRDLTQLGFRLERQVTYGNQRFDVWRNQH